MSIKAIRPAIMQDLPRIVELKLAMFAEAGLADLLAKDAQEKVLADYYHLYEENKALHYLFADDDIVVAMAGAFLKSDLPFRYYKTPVYGFLGDVYTQPSYRHQGLAKHLNKQALTWLHAQGVTMVRLLATNAARPIYESLGFQPSDEMVLHLNKQQLSGGKTS